MIGYKATDKDIKCRGYQFVPEQWHEYDGEIKLCESGFHFCEHPSGPLAYYSDPSSRLWKVEAEGVLESPPEPGADRKLVCKRIRLVEEIKIGVGYYNTGYYNTGERNTGDYNAGSYNTGHYNTGSYNTGSYNTGHYNTGHYNTGERNAGSGNVGYWNTGNRNTGNGNAGNCNATNYSAGYFCTEEPSVICFNVDTGMKREEFVKKYGELLKKDLNNVTFEDLKDLPGATPEKFQLLKEKMGAKKGP